jgi:hypothetical protein
MQAQSSFPELVSVMDHIDEDDDQNDRTNNEGNKMQD